MSIKYIKLPIYSVPLPNQDCPLRVVSLLFRRRRRLHRHTQLNSKQLPIQKIYHRTITPEPVESVPTDRYIIENLTTCEEKGLLVCNANEWIVVYNVTQAGKQLSEAYRFQADFSPKHPNVVINYLYRTPSA